MFFQIAIDGPGGVGKSTVSKLLSKKLNCLYINTGLIFRGLAWYILKYEDMNTQEALTNIIKHKNFIFKKNKWFFNGKELDEKILKSKEVTKTSSKIAQLPEIRNFVLEIEKEIAKNENVIMEGRDIGTKVFPDAILKIFLTASPKIRAERRFMELKSKNLLNDRTIQDIQKEIEERDERDTLREMCPLKKSHDAIEITSDNKSINEIVEEIEKIFKSRLTDS